jgi:hypothetical protein
MKAFLLLGGFDHYTSIAEKGEKNGAISRSAARSPVKPVYTYAKPQYSIVSVVVF